MITVTSNGLRVHRITGIYIYKENKQTIKISILPFAEDLLRSAELEVVFAGLFGFFTDFFFSLFLLLLS